MMLEIDMDHDLHISAGEFGKYMEAQDGGATTAGAKPEAQQDSESMDTFRSFDKDGDGKLDSDEVAALFKEYEFQGEETNKMMIDMDIDHDSHISAGEFQKYLASASVEGSDD